MTFILIGLGLIVLAALALALLWHADARAEYRLLTQLRALERIGSRSQPPSPP